ncbi:ADP-ribosylation factor-like protein 5B [Perkinsus chesapeaki]|uniref:ADP-ribosylation factor-like protein 5B n=1 Tax=Perkinsus chesapeaki TaxID=330153 RepID=A0A7J6LHV9_PERCH|nr:ADP-ribosylation factor-like protein 5B [Perkinsus chesapeaki]
MGAIFSSIWQKLSGASGQQESKIVIVGLSNAGKTTILYQLNLGQVVVTQPTIGSNVEEVTHKNVKFQVVDSNDVRNLVLAKMELFNALLSEDLHGASILVFANKSDIQGARSAEEICKDLDLTSIRGHSWHIQSCCAITGEGLAEGMDWLANEIIEQRERKATSAGR